MKGASPAARRYARAFFDLARKEGLIEELEKELSLLLDVVQKDRELRRLLFHPRVQKEDKKDILGRILVDANQLVRNFVFLLVDKGRLTQLEGILTSYRQLIDEHRNILKVKVRTAHPLKPELEHSLIKRLKELTGREIHLDTALDKEIIGGMVLQIGDLLIDGSIQRSMQKLRENLEKMPVGQLGVNEG